MLKIGMLDFDTSHVVEFTKRINHVGIGESQWVDGAKVVLGCPGESKLAPEKIAGYTKAMQDLGVPLVSEPKDLLGKVDVVFIEAVDGSVHLERAKPFLSAGVPCFVDKPFGCSRRDAEELIALAERKKLPIFSSSSLRYAPEVVAACGDPSLGKILGATTYGPASTNERNPGLFHYGIHAVEMLFTLMGSGCREVICSSTAGTDVATGVWADGRIASVRGIRAGRSEFGCSIFAEKKVQHLAVPTTFIYRELLKQVIACFTSGKPPIEPSVTLEIVGFIEAALTSSQNHGMPQRIAR